MKTICEVCNKEYTTRQSEYQKYKHHYCSNECRYIMKHELFLTNFDNRVGKKFILLEYKNRDSVKVQCKGCGNIYVSSSTTILRKNNCINCSKINRQKEKDFIKSLKNQLKDIKQKRNELNILAKRLDKALNKIKADKIRKDKRRQYDKIHELQRDNRIKNNGATDKDITLEKLYIRDKGICYICNNKCNYDDYKITDKGYFIAGNSYPSIEHIKPLSKGGTHTWNNVRLACRLCNSIKKDKY